jgi:arsenical pump membrane protein
LPLLVFLGSVIVLAELTAKAEVFDVVASRLARWAAGNYLALFGLCVVFASATTVFLNLDTTAVLLTQSCSPPQPEGISPVYHWRC